MRDDYSPFPNGWGQYINNLKTRVASGLVPDVIAIAIEGVRATITQDLVLPLDDLIANGSHLEGVFERCGGATERRSEISR